MRKTTFRSILVLAFLVLIPQISFAWIDTGHKIVAMIAWDEMTPKTRAAVTDLLKQHARYDKDLAAGAPEGATPDQMAEHVFAVAATWPDMVRSQNNPMRATHNHPLWHYIDIPFEDGAPAALPPEEGPPPHNCVEALTFCTEQLKRAETSPEQKAVDICWLAHLVGDVHQPLHAASRYSKDFPKGDAGGNNELVLRDPPYPDSRMKLHLLWDSVPGQYRSEFIDRYVAQGLRADPQFSRESLKAILATTDYMGWAKESHALAEQYAYLNGKLEVALNSRGNAPSTQPVPGVPPGYLENAEKVAMQRVALAGYRLADLMNSIYDPKP